MDPSNPKRNPTTTVPPTHPPPTMTGPKVNPPSNCGCSGNKGLTTCKCVDCKCSSGCCESQVNTAMSSAEVPSCCGGPANVPPPTNMLPLKRPKMSVPYPGMPVVYYPDAPVVWNPTATSGCACSTCECPPGKCDGTSCCGSDTAVVQKPAPLFEAPAVWNNVLKPVKLSEFRGNHINNPLIIYLYR